jgi:hypothetical protein
MFETEEISSLEEAGSSLNFEEPEEISDPGILEGERNKPENQPKTAKERIAEITKKHRTEEREKVKEREEKEKIKVERDEYKKKLEAYEKQQKINQETAEKKIKEASEKQKEHDFDTELDSLFDDYSKAVSEVDGDKAAKILKQINKLSREKIKAESAIKPEDIDKKLTEKEKEKQEKEFKKEAINFIQRNPWFSKDNSKYDKQKRRLAIAVELELRETFTGSPKELFKKIEEEVESVFKKPESKLPDMAGASILKNSKAKADNVELSDVQKKIARGVYPGIPAGEAYKTYIKNRLKFEKGEI